MGRILSFITKIVVTVALCSVLGPAVAEVPAHAQDSGVFRYRDRDGRQVYTNLEGSASHGQALIRVGLPPLSSVDFARAKPEELRAIDAQVRDSHSALQSGELCEAIRKSSRSPLRSRLWADHGRKITVAGGLLVFAAVLGFLGAGRKLGSLWPLAPIAGCIFLGYVVWREVQNAREALTAGLRACSEQLPDGEPDDKTAVQGRLGKALDLQNIVNATYQRQANDIDAIMRER